MPGSKKGRTQGLWDVENLKLAVRDVLMYGKSKKSVAKQYHIPRETLSRHIKKAIEGYGVEKVRGRKTVLTTDQENELSNYLQKMEESLYGLTPANVRRIVYQYCETNGIKHRFNQEKQTAGRMWFKKFMRRHPELSVRAPEPVSIQRAMGFNETKVNIFLNLLEETLFTEVGAQRKIPPDNIYNVDETGISVCHKPHKVIAKRGKKSVGAIKSAERGKNTTVVCCISATGHYIPPFIIFPRVRMKLALMDNAPSGSIGVASKSGWINEQLFTQWFEHFLAVVQPKNNAHPVLLLADGHSSHTQNLEVIKKARENNVIILIFPSHCSHKLQPLDVSFFKSLKWNYDDRASAWLLNHPGRAINEEEMVGVLNEAYGKAATVANAVSGFRQAGIHPFDREIFEGQYQAAAVTDVDEPQIIAAVDNISVIEQLVIERIVTDVTGKVIPDDGQPVDETVETVVSSDSMVETQPSKSFEESSVDNIGLSVNDQDVGSVDIVTPLCNIDNQPGVDIQVTDVCQSVVVHSKVDAHSLKPPEKSACNLKSFIDILPIPKSKTRRLTNGNKKRAVGHAKVITSSPYKKSLEQSVAERDNRPNRKRVRANKTNQICVGLEEKTCSGLKKTRPTSSSFADKTNLNESDETPCIYCDIAYCNSKVPWIRCKNCSGWACGECVTIGKKKSFNCSSCKPN